MADISTYEGKVNGGIGGGTTYFSMFGGDSEVETRTQILWLEPGVFRNFRVRLTATPTAASTVTVTLRINETSALMTLVFNPGDLDLSYTASDISISANDRLDIQTINTGSGGGSPSWTWEFEPTSGSKSVYGSVFHNGSGSTPLYFGALRGFHGQGATRDAVVGVIPCAGTITANGVCLDGAPGGSHVFTLYKSTDNGSTWIAQDGSGGTPDTRVTLSGSRTGSSTFSLSVSAGDLIYEQYDRVSGGAINVYGGCSVTFNPSVAGQFIVPGLSRLQLDTGTTQFFAGAGGITGGTTSVGGQSVATPITSIVLSNFRNWLSASPGSSKSHTAAFTIDESTTVAAGSPTITVTGSSTTGTDGSNQLGLTNGHTFTLKSVPAGTPAAAYMAWACVGVPGVVTTATAFARAQLMFFG